jgi:hypothetical protein
VEIYGKEIRIRGKLARVAYLDGEGYQFLESLEAALEAIRQAGRRIDLFTFIQKLSEPSPKFSYPMEWDNMAVLPVSTFDHWWNKQIGFKARNKAKQAEKKGIVIREVPFGDALTRGIHAIYNESPIRQGRRFWHYGKDLEAVRRTTATFLERSVFIGAFFQDSLIGFAKLVANEDWSQAGLMHILSTVQHRDKAPTNALIAQAVRSCADRKIKHLWYANFTYGKREGDSLADFKRRNAFERIDVPRYYIPFTVAGRVALRLGLHHKVIDRVPAPVAVAYRNIRKSWYARRFPGFENA